MHETPHAGSDPVAIARELCAEVRARADEIEAARKLPADLSRRLAASGFYRLWGPKRYGGGGGAPRRPPAAPRGLGFLPGGGAEALRRARGAARPGAARARAAGLRRRLGRLVRLHRHHVLDCARLAAGGDGAGGFASPETLI